MPWFGLMLRDGHEKARTCEGPGWVCLNLWVAISGLAAPDLVVCRRLLLFRLSGDLPAGCVDECCCQQFIHEGCHRRVPVLAFVIQHPDEGAGDGRHVVT